MKVWSITGLETLPKIKEVAPNVPVVMITKNEAEGVRDPPSGSQNSESCIKPVNPLQILPSVKKLMDKDRLIREQTATDYQQEFRKIFMEISQTNDTNGWSDIYKKIIHWELKIDDSKTESMTDILSSQKNDANMIFEICPTKLFRLG